MNIVLNGVLRELPDRTTVAGLVRETSGDRVEGRGVAVAVDAEVVPRSEWDTLELREGQRVEVLGAIQGG